MIEEKGFDVYNGECVANVISTFLNNMGSRRSETGEKLFLERMSREHRTIQQKYTSLSMDWLKLLSRQTHWDDRNEASVLLSKDIFNKIDPNKISAVKCII